MAPSRGQSRRCWRRGASSSISTSCPRSKSWSCLRLARGELDPAVLCLETFEPLLARTSGARPTHVVPLRMIPGGQHVTNDPETLTQNAYQHHWGYIPVVFQPLPERQDHSDGP